jgi:hypothetical protein
MFRHSFLSRCLSLTFLIAPALSSDTAAADDYVLHRFERQQLTDVYYSEGAGAGDINGDNVMDVVYGPHWYAGPEYTDKNEIYTAVPQNVEGYSDHFFAWVHDFNGDGWNDVFTVGFPGTPAYVYENPTGGKLDLLWEKHEVFDWVSNESPWFTDIVGDERPELVCTRDGFFGYATINWDAPFETWTFHIISEQIADSRFGHGLGVGDLSGDGRADVIHSGGWFEQPGELTEDLWAHHPAAFTNAYGGAEMHAYDVDGDGDNDVITSLAAHDFGLAWFEQIEENGERSFRMHEIMGATPEQNRYGVVFSELHSVALADMDGDGLKDIVTGKTYYSHHQGSPMWDAGAVVYWFKLVRGEDGVDWVPYQADDNSGIGRQVGVFDLNGDDLPDIISGGMKGAHVLLQSADVVSEQEWLEAQPAVYEGGVSRIDRGEPSVIDETTGKVPGAIEGETMKVVAISSGNVSVQEMGGFTADHWSGGEQLFWTGGTPQSQLELEFEVAEASTYGIETCFTIAQDYGMVRVVLDGDPLCDEPLDLFNHPDVRTTGVLRHWERELAAGTHQLSIELVGANDAAVKAFYVGFDYLRLVAAE